jgi:hypothetical protein
LTNFLISYDFINCLQYVYKFTRVNINKIKGFMFTKASHMKFLSWLFYFISKNVEKDIRYAFAIFDRL